MRSNSLIDSKLDWQPFCDPTVTSVGKYNVKLNSSGPVEREPGISQTASVAVGERVTTLVFSVRALEHARQPTEVWPSHPWPCAQANGGR